VPRHLRNGWKTYDDVVPSYLLPPKVCEVRVLVVPGQVVFLRFVPGDVVKPLPNKQWIQPEAHGMSGRQTLLGICATDSAGEVRSRDCPTHALVP
jgi:hypothetical protein